MTVITAKPTPNKKKYLIPDNNCNKHNLKKKNIVDLMNISRQI